MSTTRYFTDKDGLYWMYDGARFYCSIDQAIWGDPCIQCSLEEFLEDGDVIETDSTGAPLVAETITDRTEQLQTSETGTEEVSAAINSDQTDSIPTIQPGLTVDGIDWHARYEEADQCLMRIQDIMGDSDPSDEDDDLTEELWALGIIPGDEASERVQLLYDSWKMLRAESAGLRERLELAVTTIKLARRSIISMAETGVNIMRELGRECDSSADTANVVIRSCRIDEALEALTTTPAQPGRGFGCGSLPDGSFECECGQCGDTTQPARVTNNAREMLRWLNRNGGLGVTIQWQDDDRWYVHTPRQTYSADNASLQGALELAMTSEPLNAARVEESDEP